MIDRIAGCLGTRAPHTPRDTAVAGARGPALDVGLADEDVDRWVQSACVLCSNGCACDIAVKDGRMVGVRGRADDRVNHGRLGPKGLYGRGSGNGPGPPHPAARPRERPAGRVRLGHGHGPDRRGSPARCSTSSARSRTASTPAASCSSRSTTPSRVIGKAGLGTPHMDGNTRLCTATAAAAMKESFGSDGQPGCYDDIEACDALVPLRTQHGRDPDRAVVAGSRPPGRTGPTGARRGRPPAYTRRRGRRGTGGVHLAPLPGTNQALMNALLHEVIEHGWVDRRLRRTHTRSGSTSSPQPSRRTRPNAPPRSAASRPRTCGGQPSCSAPRGRVLSTVLQGFYQSHQATAAACQVNNLHLLRGMIGRPGRGVLQMNGQPTAQNTRECGADGDLPGFRNWDNPEHIHELARLWNVDPLKIPHWAPPTHAMQIWRYAEQGSIRLLWISATNPAVSLPDLARIRDILARDDLFVVVQDGFLHRDRRVRRRGPAGGDVGRETRHVHQRHPHRPPVRESGRPAGRGAQRPGHLPRLRAADGLPRPRRQTADPVVDAGRRVPRPGRSAAAAGCATTPACPTRSYAGAAESPGPATTSTPDGRERLYADGVFPTDPDSCEDYGHDLLTGATTTAERVPGHAGRTAVPSSRPRPTNRRPSSRGPNTRSRPPPAAAPTTSTPAPRPAAPTACTRRRRSHGSNCPLPTPHDSASGPASWSGWSRRAARSRQRPASARAATAWCSCRSTTATGTRTPSRAHPGSERADGHQLGPGVQTAAVQARRRTRDQAREGVTGCTSRPTSACCTHP